MCERVAGTETLLQLHYVCHGYRNCNRITLHVTVSRSLSLSFPNAFGSQRRPLGIFTDIGLRSDPVSCGRTW